MIGRLMVIPGVGLRLRLDRRLGWLATCLVFIAGVCVYLAKGFSSPLLFGIDGPYYLIQVRALFDEGRLKYPDPPLAFYILAGFSRLLGDAVSGIKVGSVVVTLLAAFPLYGLVSELCGVEAGVAAAVLYVFSGELARMCFDLIKNAMGLTWLAAALFFALLSVRRGRWEYSAMSALFVVLTGLTHILDFGVLLAVMLIWVALLVLGGRRRETSHLLPPLTVGVVLLILGFLYVGVMGGDPYKGLSYLRELLHGPEHEGVQPPSIVAFFPLLVGAAGLVLFTGEDEEVLRAMSLVMLGLGMPFNPRQFLWRFALMSAVLAPPVLGGVLGRLKDRRMALGLALILLGLTVPKFAQTMIMIGPSISPAEYEELKVLTKAVPEGAVLVVPDTRLRYWVETIYPAVIRSPKEAPPWTPLVLVVERNRRMPPAPPWAKPLFEGRFVIALPLPPRPG